MQTDKKRKIDENYSNKKGEKMMKRKKITIDTFERIKLVIFLTLFIYTSIALNMWRHFRV